MPKTEFPQFRECRENGEFVGLTKSLDQARSIIPAPTYPKAAAKKEEFHSRYGWIDEQLSDGGLLRSIPQVVFDDHPNSESRIQDFRLFGESYLVVWLCPVDRDSIRSHLQSQIRELMLDPSQSPSFSRFQAVLDPTLDPYAAFLRGNEDVEDFFKTDVVKRLCLLEPAENDVIAAVKSELERALETV